MSEAALKQAPVLEHPRSAALADLLPPLVPACVAIFGFAILLIRVWVG